MSILGDGLPGARVLDLYAGSGALGLEALSAGRGVGRRSSSSTRRRSRRSRPTSPHSAWPTASPSTGATRFGSPSGCAAGAFDVALADPPYSRDDAARLVALFRRTPFARILSVEHRADELLDGDDTRRYGDTALTFCHAP